LLTLTDGDLGRSDE
jgi:murein tripeptide amidase MpaA